MAFALVRELATGRGPPLKRVSVQQKGFTSSEPLLIVPLNNGMICLALFIGALAAGLLYFGRRPVADATPEPASV